MYKILSCSGADDSIALSSLEEEVAEAIDKGWVPDGGVSICCASFSGGSIRYTAAQSVVKLGFTDTAEAATERSLKSVVKGHGNDTVEKQLITGSTTDAEPKKIIVGPDSIGKFHDSNF
ncbi:hypothetical protein IJH16_00805 [Candidatus Saccharibacteria bacterium]|nr:hypothetical protein [Candidatus Saccharibacteria bacterium]